MAFVQNTYQQLSFVDSLNHLSEREKKLLDRSWAKPFGDDIFPKIDERKFADFYSDRSPRPNTPVNIVLGGMLLEEQEREDAHRSQDILTRRASQPL